MNSTGNQVVNGHVPVYDHGSYQASIKQNEYNEIRFLVLCRARSLVQSPLFIMSILEKM